MKKKMMSRRRFLATSSLALGVPMIIPGSALGKNGAVAPSNRIVLGAIGLGPRGRSVLQWMMQEKDMQFVAIADVQKNRRELVKKIADETYGNTDCVMYRDMFDVLERKDIDAVLIATGDRWHALATILAVKAGKDVYSEKPCSRTIGETQELADTLNKYGQVYQAGTQRRSSGNFQFAAHLARSGMLGRIHTVHASISELYVKDTWLPAQPEPDIDVCDWDRWLGPSPWRPFNQAYVDGGWRGYPEFDAGARLLDWGAHTVDLCQMALDMDGTTPVTYEVDPEDNNKIHAQYKNGVKLIMRIFPRGKGGKGDWSGMGPCPIRFEGDEGWVETGDSGIKAHPKSLLKEMQSFIVGRRNPANHVRNFFDCVKSRAKTVCNADIMRFSHIACYAAALSWTLGRKVTFDPIKEEFIGDDEANRMRTQAKRAPWHV